MQAIYCWFSNDSNNNFKTLCAGYRMTVSNYGIVLKRDRKKAKSI